MALKGKDLTLDLKYEVIKTAKRENKLGVQKTGPNVLLRRDSNQHCIEISGESGDVSVATVDSWKERLPEKCIIKSKLRTCRILSQPKAWVTAEILNQVLSGLNRQLKSHGRSVLLLMDKGGCHPADTKDKFSNIKVFFLPPNRTFTVHYRKLRM